MKRRIFLVVGMHRSVTSYLTQSLSLLGAQLPKTLSKATEDNPKGFFECPKIYRYHDILLKDVGLNWESITTIPKGWFHSEYAENAVNELVNLIKEEYPGTGPILLKDPRICIFINLWDKVIERLNLDPFYILPFRHPLEVAKSIQKRNKIGLKTAQLIWLNYVLQAESNTREKRRAFLFFPDWIHNLEPTIERLELQLNTHFPTKQKENLKKIKNEFEQAYIHHHQTVLNESADDGLDNLTNNVLTQMLHLIKNPHDRSNLKELDLLRNKFEQISELCSEVIIESEEKQQAVYKQKLILHNQQLDSKEDLIQTLQKEKTQLSNELSASSEKNETKEYMIKTLQEEKAQLCNELSATKEEKDTKEHLIKTLQEEKAQLCNELTASKEEKDTKEYLIKTLQEEKAQLCNELSSSNEEKEQLYNELTLSNKEKDKKKHEILFLQEKNKAYQEQLALIEQQRNNEKKTIRLLEGEKTKLSEKCASIEEKLQDRFKEIAIMTSMYEKSENELKKHKNEKEELNNKLSSYLEKINHLEITLHEALNKKHFSPKKIASRFFRRNGKKFKKQVRVIKKSNLFDKRWYLETYPDVKKARMDPIKHYLKFGALEGRNPSQNFNTLKYFQNNPDVAEAKLNPLFHYVLYGKKEGRQLN